MTARFSESVVETAALEQLGDLGYEIRNGVDLFDPGERTASSDVILLERLRRSLTNINHDLPPAAIEEAIRKMTNIDAVLPLDHNHHIHDAIVNGSSSRLRSMRRSGSPDHRFTR